MGAVCVVHLLFLFASYKELNDASHPCSKDNRARVTDKLHCILSPSKNLGDSDIVDSVTRPAAPQVNLIYIIRLAAAVSRNNSYVFCCAQTQVNNIFRETLVTIM